MDDLDLQSAGILILSRYPHLTVSCCARTYSDAIEKPLENKKSKLTMNDHPRICSTESLYSTFITLHNNAGCRVDVIWINYFGKPLRYLTMEVGSCQKLNTYITHPWIFRDTETGERMMVEDKDVYWPPASKLDMTDGQLTIFRQDCVITAPKRTLRTLALQKCAELLKVKENVDKLNLPKSVSTEVKTLIKFSETYQDLREV